MHKPHGSHHMMSCVEVLLLREFSPNVPHISATALTLPHPHSTLLTPSYTLIHTLHLTPHWHTLSLAPTPHLTPHNPCITSPNTAHTSPHDPPHPTSPHTTAPNFITLTSFRGILGNVNSVVKLAITFGASGHLSPWSLQASGMGGLNV